MAKSQRELERLSLSAYQRLAQDFYERSLHPTTYAFGLAIEQHLSEHWKWPNLNRPCVEVGAGRSRLLGLRAQRSQKFIMSDISLSMLTHSRSQIENNNVAFLVASAFRLPFRSSSLGGVFSILGDAYGRPAFFKEAFRVLAGEGVFLYTAPSATWGHVLRRSLGIRADVTRLRTSDGGLVSVPSILTPKDRLKEQMCRVGFFEVDIAEISLPKEFKAEEIPSHIAIAAEHLKIDPYSLPIVTVVNAVKREGGE